MINNEILVNVSKIITVLICLITIIIITWQNITKKTFPTFFLPLMAGLFFLSIWSILSSSMSLHFLLIYTLLILLYLSIQYSELKQLKSSHAEIKYSDNLQLISITQEQERSRIYANLHDDVGATLLELIYTCKDEETRERAKSILANIRQAVAQTENIQCSMIQLAESIISEAQQRIQSSALTLNSNVKLLDNQQRLNPVIPNAILRILREAITNILKHAQASEININISSNSSTLTIEINDNGSGFNPAETKGKGLRTIRKRAKTIKAEAQWHSEPTKGTTFTLKYKYANK